MPRSQPGYGSLRVWQLSFELAGDVLDLATEFPTKDAFVLRDQIQRSAILVPSNIAEGSGRGTKNDFVAFLRIASGSLRKLETQLDLAHRINLVKDEERIRLMEKCESIGRMLTRLIQSQRPSDSAP